MLWPALATAQTLPADEAPLRIGTIVVTGNPLRDAGSVGAAALRDADAFTAGPALEQVPGVAQSRVGARNEQMVTVRGFDLRQTPVFIDGVPVYVPYDGYVDLGRFTTFDLARVQVEKGASSLLYGANTLGGAINLVGRRPTRAYEADGGFGLATDHRAQAVASSWVQANLGLRQGAWYAQLDASHLAQDDVPLPGDFTPTRAEDGGARNNSDLRDRKLSAKLGFTPRGDDEYAINVVDQHGTKGTPPYAGALASVAPRYWRWPYWDKQSAYALSRTAIGEHVLKLRLFHDVFRNALFTYDDGTYSTQKKPSSFQSWYDDFSNGASAQFDARLSATNTLGLAAHWKRDTHRENNAGEPVRRFRDETQSFAIEDRHRFSTATSLVLGAGHDTRRTLQAQDYNSSTKAVSDFALGRGSANNALLALEQALGADGQLRASLARKSRFPTIKDRYSYRLGTALPNADLAPERATHAEVGISGRLSPNASFDLAVFRSSITDLIQSVTVATRCGSNACTQMQNIGRARAQGAELSGQWRMGAWRLDGHVQYLDRRNLSSSVLLTDTPRLQGQLHAAWLAAAGLELHGFVRSASRRWSSSDGAQVAGGFTVADVKARWNLSPQFSVEAGLHNAGDQVYAYSEGFPEPGRQLVVQARITWP